MAEKNWSEKPSEEWDEEAQETLEAFMVPNAARPTRIHLAGKCPRCEHEMTFDHPLVTVHGLDISDDAADAAAGVLVDRGVDLSSGDVHVDARCQCTRAHPRAPKGAVGCGAPFVVRVEWP